MRKKGKISKVRKVVSIRLLPFAIKFFKGYRQPNSRMARLLEAFARNKIREMLGKEPEKKRKKSKA